MLVRDLMEEKQLNLNQPLLSVRRFSSTKASESENERKSIDNSLVPSYKSELKSGPVRNASAVPFRWEKTPGRPKDECKLPTHVVQPPISPNMPPGKVPKFKQQDSDIVSVSLDKKVTKVESSKVGIEEEGSSDSDDGDEAYQDAVETLSRTESLFTSCGMSVYDDQEVQVKSNGTFSSKEKTCDFMIDRFLPAAKAMISETPQCASKKPVVGQGQQKRSSPLIQHRPKSLRRKEGDIFESDDSENYTLNTSTCGLFPHFCLLSPISRVRMENKVQSNAGCNSTASPIETAKEHARGRGELLACESTQLETSYDTPSVEKTLYIDSIHKTKFQTNHKEGDFETLKSDNIHKNLSVDSSIENSGLLDDSPFLVCSENLSNGMQMEITNYDSKKIDSEKLGNQGSDLEPDSVTISSPKMVDCKKIDDDNVIKSRSAAKLIDQEHRVEDDGKIDLESQCGVTLGHHELSDTTNFFEIPLVLPSLKAPSESWLERTLPTISTRNTSSKSKPCCKYFFKTASMCPKWETLRSSNVQHGRVQLQEEVVKPIAED